jgi:hypothetical protein
MSRVQTALFLAFPDVGEQDLLAAWELFRSHAWSTNSTGEDRSRSRSGASHQDRSRPTWERRSGSSARSRRATAST